MSGTVYTAMGSQNSSAIKPPEKGSFPLDHDGECKAIMKTFLTCLHSNNNDNSKCRNESMKYLGCRMENNLMEKETWKKLGYEDLAPKVKT